MIGWKNLDGYVRAAINGGYPDIGQIHYVVDSDFRTAAQGWSRADRTGPLDLWSQRQAPDSSQYVYYTPGTGNPIPNQQTTDRNTIQAAIDAMVDFRGDTCFFTPGSYSIATTSLALDVPNARYLGPPVKNPMRAAVTITDAIGDNGIDVDDMEIAFIRFVPLTAQNWFDVTAGADGCYIHDCFYDTEGVSTSTSTEFILAANATADWLIENVVMFTDAAQGDFATMTSALRWTFNDCKFIINAHTQASLFTFVTTASFGVEINRPHVIGEGASSILTNFVTGMAGAAICHIHDARISGTALATVGDIETGFDATVGIEIARSFITGDASGEGGAAITLT